MPPGQPQIPALLSSSVHQKSSSSTPTRSELYPRGALRGRGPCGQDSGLVQDGRELASRAILGMENLAPGDQATTLPGLLLDGFNSFFASLFLPFPM